MRKFQATTTLLVTGALSALIGCSGEAPRPEGPDSLAQKPQAQQPQAKPDEAPAVAQAPAAPATGEQQALDPPPEGDGGNGRPAVRGALGDLERELSLEEQERKALAQNYFKTGKRLFQEMRYQEAEDNLHRAVKLDPGHAQAQRLLERTQWITGSERSGEHKETVRVMAEERLAKIQQAKIELDRLMTEGDLLMDRQRYDEAQERYQRVLEAIRWFPYNIEDGGIQARAQGKIAEARQKADEQARRRRHMLQNAARQAAEFERANNRRFLEATLKALLEDAKDAFRAGKYEKCESICDDILRRQADHAEASDLRDQAMEASYREKVEETYRDRVEHWRRQIEWIEASSVPYQELFSFPDAAQWAEISARDVPIRKLLEQQKGASEAELQINRRLASQRVTLNFDQTPFDEAINFLRDITGLNYVLSADARELVDSEGVTVSLRLREITLDNALKLILASHESLTWRIEDGVIKIGTNDDVQQDLVLQFYDVTEIVNSPPDFPAPELGLNLASGGGGGGGSAGGVLSFDDTDEEKGATIDADTLIELIESKLGEEDDEGSVEYSGGILIVRKPLRSHEKILKLLDALRRSVGVMVTVEARFVEVQDNLLEQIGVDIVNQPSGIDTFGTINSPRSSTAGPGAVQVGYNYTNNQGDANVRAGIVNALSSLAPAGLPFNITNIGGIALQYNFLDNFQLQAVLDAVRKTQKSKIINAPRITVFNGQRSHILNISQRAYIQDVEVNQTGVIPVLNPVIGIINTGAILEVRPTVSHDRRYVTLEVKPTLATELPPRIPNPVTLAGGFTSIPIELPVITIRKLRATVTVPDGGTVLLGGLKNFDEFEGESGVPFLLKVPLLNNLFRRQAFHTLRASLVVLLKADITIIREKEKDIFGRE